MSFWKQLLTKLTKKHDVKQNDINRLDAKNHFDVIDIPESAEFNVDNIRKLLLNGFTTNEVFSLKQFPDCQLNMLKGNENKTSIVMLLLESGNYALLLKHAQEINPIKFNKYGPYVVLEQDGIVLRKGIKKKEKSSSVDEKKGLNSNEHQKPLKDVPKHLSLEELNQNVKEETEKRKLRQQIIKELNSLFQLDKCDLEKIIEILIRYKNDYRIFHDAWANSIGGSPRFPTDVIKLVMHGDMSAWTEDYVAQRVLETSNNWLKQQLSTPVLINVPTSEHGPHYKLITKEYIKNTIVAIIGKTTPDFEITYIYSPINKPGIYSITLQFTYNYTIYGSIKIDLIRDPLPDDCRENFKDLSPLDLNSVTDIITQLKEHLDAPSKNLFNEEHKMAKVLITAYSSGYWKAPWVQGILQNWRTERQKKLAHSKTMMSYKENSVTKLDFISKLFQLYINDDEIIPVSSELVSSFNLSAKQLAEDLMDIDGKTDSEILTGDYADFLKGLKIHSKLPAEEYSKKLLFFAACYIDRGDEELTKFCLAEYCFINGYQIYLTGKKRDARKYLQLFIFFYSTINGKSRKDLDENYFVAASCYFDSYDINLMVKNNHPKTSDDFKNAFIGAVSALNTIEPFGRCILEISLVYFNFIFHLIESMRQILSDTSPRRAGNFLRNVDETLRTISKALQNPNIFKLDPICSLRILEKTDPVSIGDVLFSIYSDRQNVAKKLVTVSLIKLIRLSKAPYENYLNRFNQLALPDVKSDLAFSVFIEPIRAKVIKKELQGNALKADVIMNILGIQAGTTTNEFMSKKIYEIAESFDDFVYSENPNQKSKLASDIQNNIDVTRVWLNGANFPFDSAPFLFINKRIADYLHSKKAELIRDTVLEIRLMTNEVSHSDANTRIILEISNIEEGQADGVELIIKPVTGEYDVEQKHSIINIGIIDPGQTIQREIKVHPVADSIKVIKLKVELRYNTLYRKSLVTSLGENSQVRLYTASEFKRIPQLYSISAPATNLFYGRKDKLDSIVDNLRYELGNPYDAFAGKIADNLHYSGEKDNSMIVYGIKRAGKTSVVKRFLDHTLEERGLLKWYIPIYIDILADPRTNSINNDCEFLFYLIEVIIEKLPANVKSALDVNPRSFQKDFQAQPFEVFSYILDEILAAISPMRLLIILDEFSTLRPKFERLSKTMLGFLGNTIQSNIQLTFIFTGTYILLDMMREYALDLAKFCTSLMISYLDENSARLLITEPFARINTNHNEGGIEFDPRVVDQIMQVTNCDPYLIQYLGIQLVNHLNERKSTKVNLFDLDEIIKEIVTQPIHQQILSVMWDEFDINHGKVLSIIASHSTNIQLEVGVDEILKKFEEFGDPMPLGKIIEICSTLTDAELLKKPSGERIAYRISIPLYKMWLQHNKPIASMFASSRGQI